MKQVKKYFSTVLFALFSIGFICLILDYNGISIHKKIEHTIAAGIYANGIQVGRTYVTVSGKYYPHLFTEDKFFGKFTVLEVPRLCTRQFPDYRDPRSLYDYDKSQYGRICMGVRF